jgi:hypothetical protein
VLAAPPKKNKVLHLISLLAFISPKIEDFPQFKLKTLAGENRRLDPAKPPIQ